MTFSTTDSGYLLRLEPGEDVVRCLIRFAREQEVDAAYVTAAGAVTEVELGTGGDQPREHRRSMLAEPLEVCSLTGTVTLLDGEPFPQLHGSFARSDGSLLGGHVYQALCGRRLELAVQVSGPAPPNGTGTDVGRAIVAHN